MPGPVALTGATGFIGRHLANHLRTRGFTVRALTRRPQPHLEGLAWIPGDLSDLAALARLLDGASFVVHCAGVVRGASVDDFDRVNAAGTANLIAAALALPRPPPFLLISSLAAREPDLSWYAASKRKAETRLAAADGLPVR